MDYLISLITSVLSSYNLIEQQPVHEASIANLSTRDRASLVQDVALEINHEDTQSNLTKITMGLEEHRATLDGFERKKRFLGVRLDRYRMLMGKREDHIHELMDRIQQREQSQANNDGALLYTTDGSDDDDDLENKNMDNMKEQLDSLQFNHVEDQELLADVEQLHIECIALVETFRRKVNELEEKQQGLIAKRDECQEFLVIATEYHGEE